MPPRPQGPECARISARGSVRAGQCADRCTRGAAAGSPDCHRLRLECLHTPREFPMETVTSADGPRIAFDRLGAGPPLIVIGGASGDGGVLCGNAAALARHFTVLNYDRRGRGDSGDTLPYAVEREIEDPAA